MNCDSECFRLVRCKELCFFKAHKLNRRLFHKVLFIVIGIGRLRIDLYNLLAGGRAGVRDLDGHCSGVIDLIKGHADDFLYKRGIAHSEAERPYHLIIIAPRAGISLTENAVLVSGFKIAVVRVYSLSVDNVVFCL